MPTTICILIFVASPLDYARYRHAALYLEFESYTHDAKTGLDVAVNSPSNIKSSLMEVVGSTGLFTFSERINSEVPVSSSNLARVIRVSSIPDSASGDIIRKTVSETPINTSESGDWNSQNWAGDALGRLVAAGLLDAKDRDRALDEMVDVVVEAGDEEIEYKTS